MRRILEHRKQLFDSEFERVIYSCPEHLESGNSDYCETLKVHYPDIEFVYGLPKIDSLGLRLDRSPKLLLIDDQFEKACNSKEILDIFCIYSHHFNISICLTGHNAFQKCQFSTTLARNLTAMIIFHDKADQLFLSTLSRRYFPSNHKLLIEAFDFLFENFPETYCKYLVIDTSPKSHLPQKLMVRTNIFPESDNKIRPIFFVPSS